MKAVSVLTIRHAADQFGKHKSFVSRMLVTQALTTAYINGRPAVLEDSKYRAALKKAA
jgi:hypothetical protein